jgi:DNA-nicking Smr family endonuclease
MANRSGSKKPLLADFHLWTAVAGTVLPLQPRRRTRITAPLPLPQAVPPASKPPIIFVEPPYQPSGARGSAPAGLIEPKLRRRLGRGRVPIDGSLDLHGLRQDEAYSALTRYVAARAGRGDRTILVITGKGLKKLNGDPATIVERGVLRTMLPIWLNSPELKQWVSGWDQSAQAHGGEGAWYVRLRRQAK